MKLVGLLILVQLSTCIHPDRMVRYYEYHSPPSETFDECKHLLTTLGYTIEIATREEGILTTEFRHVSKDIRRYDYAIAILVKDVIEVYIIAKRHIFKRGSETSIGSDMFTGAQTSDMLPYSIQSRLFHDIELGMRIKGFFPFERSDNKISSYLQDFRFRNILNYG